MRQWSKSPWRKPLLLRGARQVGKTSVVNLFAREYDQYISLNLERESDRQVFEKFDDVKELVQYLFLQRGFILDGKKTLIFIDEIQNYPKAVNRLRYFYEDMPEVHVIAAGSLLETLFDRKVVIPVGRVNIKIMRPVSFKEFLYATGEEQAAEMMGKIPVPEYAVPRLFELFNKYTLMGGMPEVVNYYAATRQFSGINEIYDSLLKTYLDDVEKYATTQTKVAVLRHTIKSVMTEAGLRISYQGFGKSEYRSREIREALLIMEKALLINLVYPTAETTFPLIENLNKSPRLQLLDTGLLNYFSGIQSELLAINDLTNHYRGRIAEHVVGQELLSKETSPLKSLDFWVREKRGSGSEVDFLITHRNKVVPVEVKSGAKGRLRSLHQFMEESPYDIAVRLYGGVFSVDEMFTPSGKKFKLVNLPYFLASVIDDYLDWLVGESKSKRYGGVDMVKEPVVEYKSYRQLLKEFEERVKPVLLDVLSEGEKLKRKRKHRRDLVSDLCKVVYDIDNYEGLRANRLSKLLGIPLSTLERHLSVLKKAGVIDYRGAPKTGGYYLTEDFAKKIE